MDETILELTSITHSFFGVPAVRDVSFSLRRGQVLCLIGENGAGKSTLMNIIGGVLSPDSGTMRCQGRLYTPRSPRDAAASGIAFIHQELNLFPNLSVAENIFLESFPRLRGIPLIARRRMRGQARTLLEQGGLEISPETLVEKLSPGERQLVEIAKAISLNPEVIIFDEPTTSLTSREKERLFELIGRMRAGGKSMIYISHILQEVARIHDAIVVLRDGEVTGFGGKDEFPIERMVSLMVGHDIRQLYPTRQKVPGEKCLLTVRKLSRAGMVKDIDFDLHEGEVVGLFGLMGSGRTELARILFGLDRCDQGTISLSGRPAPHLSPPLSISNNVAFITEDRRGEGLLMNNAISENVELVALPAYSRPPFGLINRRALAARVVALIKELRIRVGWRPDRSPAKSLSGGNQQKVVIGKWLLTSPRIVIADEPTRGIDIGSKREVYGILTGLANAGNGVLFISSEIEELMGICDRILVMNRGEILCAFSRAEFDQERIMAAAFRAGGNSRQDIRPSEVIPDV